MLRHSLVMQKVTIPELPPAWPQSLDLELGLQEVVLLDGVGWEEGKPFMQVAASLNLPLAGEVLFWGQDQTRIPRPELFRLRQKIAYLAPGQVLLHGLTIGENLALTLCYHQGLTVSRALGPKQELLDNLHLTPYLSLKPPHLPPEVYWRGLLARELIKEPQLFLALLGGPHWTVDNQEILREILQDYIERSQGAIFLAGCQPHLETFQPLAHRVLRVEAGRLAETPLPERRQRSPVAYLRLV